MNLQCCQFVCKYIYDNGNYLQEKYQWNKRLFPTARSPGDTPICTFQRGAFRDLQGMFICLWANPGLLSTAPSSELGSFVVGA